MTLYAAAGRVLHTRNTMATANDDVTARVAAGARRAIEAHGWQGATLARIADASSLSRMTLHRPGHGWSPTRSRTELLALLARGVASDRAASASTTLAS